MSDRTALHNDPEKLAQAILETIASLQAAHRKYEGAVKQEAVAERDYKLARAQAFLKAEGTAGQREAERDVEADPQYQRYLLASGYASVTKERIVSLRTEVSVLQSLLAAHRAEWQAAGIQQKYGT
jgi:hypothetical protein